jgi:hypothetical protein
MIRQNPRMTFAIAATTIGLAFAGSEMSGAIAQDAAIESATAIAPVETDLTVAEAPAPVFVSEEVVQPVPEVVEEDLVVPEPEPEPEPEPAPRASSLGQLVANTNTNYELTREMRCLAGTVYFEARGEPLAGQLAVAKVVMNRSDDRRFPSGYCGVVYQRSQFSFVRGGRMPSIKTNSAAWRRAKAIAKIAHEGLWESEARDSLYFHANYVSPSWSRKKSRRARINTHIFYR